MSQPQSEPHRSSQGERIVSLFGWVDRQLADKPTLIRGLIAAGILLVAGLDYLTGTELSFALFYLAPIALAAWHFGANSGRWLAIVAALIGLFIALTSGHTPTPAWMPWWNSAIQLGMFLLVSSLMTRLHTLLLLEQSLADTDPLTGLLNRRAFSEALEREISRAERYAEPFTLAYIDLDNFKQVNDEQGHAAGDDLLRRVGATLNGHTRTSDQVARLGGDEFALLLPMSHAEEAVASLHKLRDELLHDMQMGEWPVTFSIGAVTWSHKVGSVGELMRRVDELMYRVKKQGKDALQHESH